MGVLEVLLIVFIVLKLIGSIAWTWPVVLIPLWIMIGLYVLVYGAIIGIGHFATRGR